MLKQNKEESKHLIVAKVNITKATQELSKNSRGKYLKSLISTS